MSGGHPPTQSSVLSPQSYSSVLSPQSSVLLLHSRRISHCELYRPTLRLESYEHFDVPAIWNHQSDKPFENHFFARVLRLDSRGGDACLCKLPSSQPGSDVQASGWSRL